MNKATFGQNARCACINFDQTLVQKMKIHLLCFILTLSVAALKAQSTSGQAAPSKPSTHFSAPECAGGVDAGPDIFACSPPGPPVSIQLEGYVPPTTLSFNWLPPVPQLGTPVLKPKVLMTDTIGTYVLHANVVDDAINVVQNGDFELGNLGFTIGAIVVAE